MRVGDEDKKRISAQTPKTPRKNVPGSEAPKTSMLQHVRTDLCHQETESIALQGVSSQLAEQ